MRLFETAAQADAFWVFLATGLALGTVDVLFRVLRLWTGDRWWLHILLAPPLALMWLVATVWAVEYAYPHGWRAWQFACQVWGYTLCRLGPGAWVLGVLRQKLAPGP